jgi:hypothetical protein
MPVYMVEIKFYAERVEHKAIVAKDEAHARLYARQSELAQQSATVSKELSSSEIEGLGLEARPEGHIEPWIP